MLKFLKMTVVLTTDAETTTVEAAVVALTEAREVNAEAILSEAEDHLEEMAEEMVVLPEERTATVALETENQEEAINLF